MRWTRALRTWLAVGAFVTMVGAACSERASTREERAAPDATASTAEPAPKANPAPRADAQTPAGARSWPMFGGTVGRNMVAEAETGLAGTWSIKKGKQKNIKWSAKLGGVALGGPIVSGGRIFMGTNRSHDPKDEGEKGVMMCLDEATGKFLWEAVHDKTSDESGAQHYGIVSAPCVEGDRVYYVNNRWEVICADTAGEGGKAKILWTLDMVKELKVSPTGIQGSLSICSPLIVEDLLFVVTANGADMMGKVPAPEAPSFIAVDKKTGKVAWQSNAPGKNILDGQWGNPAAAKINGRWQVIFPGGDGWLYGFEAKSGELLWKFDCNPKGADFKAGGRGTKNYIVATPVVWDNKVFVATGRHPDEAHGEGHIWCIDITKEPKNKDKDLSPVENNFNPTAADNKDSGLVWHFGGAVKPKPQGAGREFLFGRSDSTAAIHDGLLYVADLVGFLYCFDARTGQKLWDHDLKANVWASPFYADGKVYLGGDDGTMYVFAAGKERPKPAKIDMSEALLGPPVAVNGVLYVSNGYNLFAIAAEKR
jgi:outer membrane protein assembly factor BamB